MVMLDYVVYVFGRLLAINPILAIVGTGSISYGLWGILKRSWSSFTNGWRHRKVFLKRYKHFIYDLRSSLSQLKIMKPSHFAKSFGRQSIKWIRMIPQWLFSFLLLVVWNLVVRALDYLPFIHRERKRFAKEMRPILYFKTPRSFVVMGLAFSVIALMLTNYVVALLRACFHYLYLTLQSKSLEIAFDQTGLAFSNLWWFASFSVAPILAVPIFLLGLGLAWRSAWINSEQYRNYNNNEEGDDRFATEQEIKDQYIKVPNKAASFEGNGGIPVFHKTKKSLGGVTLRSHIIWQNRKISPIITHAQKILGIYGKPSGYYYIETNPTNMLGLGTTRSGKGEGFITETIDINSRAKEKPSMVIADPKGEHYQSSYKTMRQRGYDVEVLSFQNMDWSMSYNPLALAIEAAKKGYYEKAQTYVNAVAEAIYRKTKPGMGNGNAKYWEDTSISLFNAITIALFDRANEALQNGEDDAWDTVTIRNVAKFLTDLGSEEVLVDSSGMIVEEPMDDQILTKKSKLTVYFDNLRQINQRRFSKFREMADINFRASDFASEETKGNVFSSMMAGITLFLQDNVAKLTSKNAIDLTSVGFPRRLAIRFRSSHNRQLKNAFLHQTAKITMTSHKQWGKSQKEVVHVKEATALVDEAGYLTFVIAPKLPDTFQIRIDFNHDANDEAVKDQVFLLQGTKVYQKAGGLGNRPKKDPYSGEATLDKVALTIQEAPKGSLLQLEDIELTYSDKPKVIYLVTPPNQVAYNALVSLFLDQLFNANYEMALSSGRKTVHRIVHVLDEFTNIPMIPHMETKISIGLGQNILYYLWIQNLEQLSDKYGDNVAATIRSNCSIEVYIKSNSDKTNSAYSKALGTRTITSRHRSANIIDEANPNVSVTQKKQELLTPTQLSKLQEGEAVILRGVKGRDKKGRKVTTDPIFLREKTSLPYRYMFLEDAFDQSMTLSDIPVKSGHRGLDLQDIAVDAKTNFNHMIAWRYDLISNSESRLAGRKRPQAPKQFESMDDLYDQTAIDLFQEDSDYTMTDVS